MTSPQPSAPPHPAGSAAMSAVIGKLLSPATRAGYAADWALFTDWCTATHRVSLPAKWDTITGFTSRCPGAPATIRRRLAAIAHHHRAAGHRPPVDPEAAEQPGLPSREPVGTGQVEMLMHLLPSHGWTAGVFGRRDRALLTLAAATPISYRQLAAMTVGQLHLAGGVATINARDTPLAHNLTFPPGAAWPGRVDRNQPTAAHTITRTDDERPGAGGLAAKRHRTGKSEVGHQVQR